MRGSAAFCICGRGRGLIEVSFRVADWPPEAVGERRRALLEQGRQARADRGLVTRSLLGLDGLAGDRRLRAVPAVQPATARICPSIRVRARGGDDPGRAGGRSRVPQSRLRQPGSSRAGRTRQPGCCAARPHLRSRRGRKSVGTGIRSLARTSTPARARPTGASAARANASGSMPGGKRRTSLARMTLRPEPSYSSGTIAACTIRRFKYMKARVELRPWPAVPPPVPRGTRRAREHDGGGARIVGRERRCGATRRAASGGGCPARPPRPPLAVARRAQRRRRSLGEPGAAGAGAAPGTRMAAASWREMGRRWGYRFGRDRSDRDRLRGRDQDQNVRRASARARARASEVARSSPAEVVSPRGAPGPVRRSRRRSRALRA